MLSGSRTRWLLPAMLASAPLMAAAAPDPADAGQPVNVFIRTSGQADSPDPIAADRLAQLVCELSSTDLKIRSQADRTIADDPSISLPMLERVLKDSATRISPDARERLLSASRVRFNNSPRAAMGIQFWVDSSLRDRVIIEKTFAEFPDAHAKLEPGDMVIEAGGLKTVGPLAQRTFQSVIVSRDPGDIVPILVRRGDQKLGLNVRLGRRDELRNNNFATPDMLERAWRVRAGSLMGGEVTVIAPPAQPINWGDPNRVSPQALRAALRQKGMGDAAGSPTLLGGGMPRGAEITDYQAEMRFAAQNGNRNAQLIRLNNQMVWVAGGVIMQPFDPGFESNVLPMSPQEELDQLRVALNTIKSTAVGNRPGKANRAAPQQMGGGAIGGVDPPMTAQQFTQFRAGLIEKQIDAIRAEMRESGLTIQDLAPPPAQAGHDNAEAAPPPVVP